MPVNPLLAPPRHFKRRLKKPPVKQAVNVIPKAEVSQPVENPADYNEYTLRACTQEDIDNVRTHILKFQSKQKVDPSTFTQPVRLHRKETRNLQYQLTRAEIEQRQKENAAEKERIEAERAEAERRNGGPLTTRLDHSTDANIAPEPIKSEEQKKLEKQEKILAKIGPDSKGRKGKQQLKRKTRRINAINDEVRKLRYEEYYPWVMEDYDGKNTFVGSYEAGNSDTYALLVCDSTGFKMIPADKVYKFTPRNKYSTLTLEEAEKRMEKNGQVPRWLMKHLDESEQKLTRYERTKKKLKTVVGTAENDKGGRDSDNDDLDFEEDFADDEEAPIIDGDEEENRESEKRIKREMRGANAMGLHDDEEDDDDDLFEDRKVDKEGERVRKALLKTDMSGLYESDEEENPYFSKSDLEDEEELEEELIKADLVKSTSPAANVNTGRKSSPSPPVKSIRVKSINRPIGVVVFKALPSVLVKFPKGDWNPHVKKRFIESSDTEDRSSKRVKLEATEPEIPQDSGIKVEEGGAAEQNANELLTEQDIIDIVTAEKVTAKDLIHKLRGKLAKHPDNKTRIKVLVKKLLKGQDGFLVLKGRS